MLDRWRFGVLLVSAAACRTPAAEHLDATSSDAASPTIAEAIDSGPPDIPAVDVSCDSDLDCQVTNIDLRDNPVDHPWCCTGCGDRAVNRRWLASYDAVCRGKRSPRCRVSNCVTLKGSAPVARCVAHQCAIDYRR